jgi:hypothetical protein
VTDIIAIFKKFSLLALYPDRHIRIRTAVFFLISERDFPSDQKRSDRKPPHRIVLLFSNRLAVPGQKTHPLQTSNNLNTQTFCCLLHINILGVSLPQYKSD